VTSKERPVAVRRVVVVHSDLDLALLQLENTAVPPREPLRFAAAPPAVGDAVVAIGFPAREDGNHFFVPAVFESRFGVKRAAPGRLAEVTETALQHDCSTLKGSSGSPLLGLTTHEVVGVHAEGVFSWRNTAVPGALAAEFVEGHA
jgi:endonuclease G, mitochondrial